MEETQEQAFVRAFITLDKQERYLQLLAAPKRRRKILNELYHSLSLIGARTTRIAPRDHSAEAVEKVLRQKGAGQTCYLISPEPELDQQEMALREVLDLLIYQDRVAVACCLSGRLAYYKSELDGYILEHRPDRALS